MPPFLSTLLNRALGVSVRAAHGLLKASWFIRRPKTFGAHAVALTPESKLILVRLRYAPCWRLPGGGRNRSEDPRDAAVRELREEIGMSDHGEVKLACELEESVDFKRDTASVVIVRDVRYRPKKWSWEVERVREAGFDSLPSDLSPQTRRWLSAIAPLL